MEAIELKATRRDKSGKGPSRRYRMEGLVPAVVYGSGDAAVSLTIAGTDLQKIIRSKQEKHFIKLIIDGEERNEKISMLKEIQYEPMTRKLFHADFHEIDMTHKLTVEIPLNFLGTPVGVVNGGELQHLKRALRISCLPSYLPDYLEVDLSGMEIGDAIKVKNIKLPEGVVAIENGDAGVATVSAVKSAAPTPQETAAASATPAAVAKPAAGAKGKAK